jgi:hypothetical protein
MPDVLGYWDRRADDPDYVGDDSLGNPIFRKSKKRLAREKREGEMRSKQRENWMKKVLSDVELTPQELIQEGYDSEELVLGYISSSRREIIGKLDGGKRGKKGFLILEYDASSQFAYQPASGALEDVLEHLNETLKLKEFLDGKGIAYRENPSRKEFMKELIGAKNKIDGLLKRLER